MAGKIPMRRCVGCGEMFAKSTLIRVLKTSDGFCIDGTMKKNGRGAYICPKRECFDKAISKRRLEQSFKCALPQEIKVQLREEIECIENG